MGYYRHHAILVTGWDQEQVQEAQDRAWRIFAPPLGESKTGLPVSHIRPAPVNEWHSFAVFPDGGNEWSENSRDADARRQDFIRWLQSHGGPSLSWCEVQYGDTNGVNAVLQSGTGSNPPQDTEKQQKGGEE